LVQHNEDGTIQEKQAYSTGGVCRQIRHVVDTPEAPVSTSLDPKHRWQIDIRGPSDYVERRKAELAGPGVRIRAFKTSVRNVKVRESDGVPKAFGSYLEKFVPPYGTERQVLEQLAQERVSWQ
jgi:hypothetical protein